MDRLAWCPLPATHPAVPLLLVSATFGPSSYSVHMTDLVHVWSEILDRRQICLRALRDDTPIDPTCDAEQMGVLLAELAKVAKDDAATKTSLETATTSDLRLHLTCSLPAPLAPLHWAFQLRLQPPAAIATTLVLPLLRDRRARRREAAFLIAALRDKDAVIARLADKLDALGAGMETAFPGAARRGGGSSGSGSFNGSGRPVSREVLEERVRGLAPFDAQKRKRNEAAEDDANNSSTDLADLLGEELACEVDGTTDTSTDLDGWWHKLDGPHGVQLVSRNHKDVAKDRDTGGSEREVADGKGTAAHDGFHSTKKRQNEDTADESTDEDKDKEEADRPSSPAPVAPKKANPSTKTRLGRLGGKKKALTPPPASPPPKETVDNASDTASETGDDLAEEPKSSPVATEVPIHPQRHGGLGRIGKGKALGRIGKIGSQQTVATADTPEPTASPQKAVETEAEKAKQQERIQNVVKQNAAPVRKKRKF